MEENESSAMIEDWKVDLCQKRIQYWVQDEDLVVESAFEKKSQGQVKR